jgi:ketol-acid reductoisomerase
MDWMYSNCSTTAQRGALDWFRAFRNATRPVFEDLYEKVRTGEETRRTLECNSRATYREDLESELKAIRESEMWRVGAEVRQLRPERSAKAAKAAKVAKAASQPKKRAKAASQPKKRAKAAKATAR